MQHYFDNVKDIIAKLRDPNGGCPWDLEQTHETLTPYLIEESYELLQALLKNDGPHIKEELGDVLLQILLHAQIKSEEGQFSIEDVCNTLAEKMVRRHPHVFNNESGKKPSMNDLHEQWGKIKKAEGKKEQKYFPEKDLNNPSLMAANKIGKKSNKIDFDWETAHEVYQKVEEEFSELKEAKKSQASKNNLFENKVEEELGDFLFTAAQLSRHLGYEPEVVLHKANKKFLNRFQKLIQKVEEEGRDFNKLSRNEKEEYWKKVKQDETL